MKRKEFMKQDFEAMHCPALLVIAKRAAIKRRWRMRKAELIKAIKKSKPGAKIWLTFELTYKIDETNK